MKIWYKNERKTGKILCFIASAGVLSIWAYSMITRLHEVKANAGINQFGILLFAISTCAYAIMILFLMKCGRLISKNAEQHREWHCCLKQHGVKLQGEVIEIIEKKTRKASSNHIRYDYYFRVKYLSPQSGTEKQFVTPSLCVKPKQDKRYICDVYEVYDIPAGYRDTAIEAGTGKISLNPFNMLSRIEAQYQTNWFGNCIADNFRVI